MPTYLNDRPIEDVIDAVLRVDGHIAPTVTVRTRVPVANAPGLFGIGVEVAPRTVQVVLDVRSTTPVARAATIDNLARRLKGLLLLRTDDTPDRELYCTCSGVEVSLYNGAYALGTVSVELTFTAVDPTRYERDAICFGLTTSRREVPVGTVPSAPLIYLYGGSPTVTGVQIITRNYTGDEVSRMTTLGSLASTSALLVDCAKQSCSLYTAGVLQANGNAFFASGSFPVLDPEDSLDGAGITLELTSSAGTPTGLVLYRKGY